MSCCLNNQKGELRAVLIFKRSQLLYDVANVAYIEGLVLDRDQWHNREVIQDVAQQGNIDRVTRLFDLSVAQCREGLYPFTRHEIVAPVRENDLERDREYYIILKVPDDFSQSTLDLLEKLVHEYIICRTMADWMGLTNPHKKENWLEKAAEMMSEIRSHLHARMKRVRRTMHPF